MIMPTYGQIGEFNPENDSIVTYLERVDLFFQANAVPDEKKVPVLLSVIGGKTYGILHDVLSPTKPQDKSYEELSTVLNQQFKPKQVIMKGFIFIEEINCLMSQLWSMWQSLRDSQPLVSLRNF